MNESAFPLTWPTGWPRTASRQSSRFQGTPAQLVEKGIDVIVDEVRRLGGTALTVSTNVKPTLGKALERPKVTDPGAAIYFTLKGRRIALASDKWISVGENLWALAKHLEALRGQERWGVGTMEQAFSGYMALPASSATDCWAILGVNPGASESLIMAAYRDKSKAAHPDGGGNALAFQKLTAAKDEAIKLTHK